MTHEPRGFHALGGNMPFLGGTRISTVHGEVYADWLTQRFGGTGHTDYVGYFFRRGAELLAERGTVGFIATNAITDGDNRRTVLGPLVTGEPALDIHAATTGLPWPGNAQVLVSTVHLARGLPGEVLEPRVLDGRAVASINSRLREGVERPDPAPLAENAGLALVGCFLRGEGFVLHDVTDDGAPAHPGRQTARRARFPSSRGVTVIVDRATRELRARVPLPKQRHDVPLSARDLIDRDADREHQENSRADEAPGEDRGVQAGPLVRAGGGGTTATLVFGRHCVSWSPTPREFGAFSPYHGSSTPTSPPPVTRQPDPGVRTGRP